MDAAPVNTVDRILSPGKLVRWRARRAELWSVLASVLLLLLLLDLSLLLGLSIERGKLDVMLDPLEFQHFEEITGLKLVNLLSTIPPASTPEEQSHPGAVRVTYNELGILPEVWQTRDTWWGGAVAFLFREIDWLESNVLALIWLLCVGSLLVIFRSFCLRRVRTGANRIAVDAVAATRRNLHRQVLRLGPEDVDGTGHETATRLFTVEVETIRNGLYESISRLIRFAPELGIIAIALLSLNWRLTLQWIAPSALLLMLVDRVFRAALRNHELAVDRCRDDEQILLASFKNARLTRGLGLEQSEHERFQKHLDRYHSQLTASTRAADDVRYPHSKIVIACVVLLAFLLFLLGGSLLLPGNSVASSHMSTAQALTFLITVSLALPGIRAIRQLGEIRREMTLAAEKVNRYLEQLPTVSQAVGAKFLQPMSKTLHFENVTYQTSEGRKLLDGIDFSLQVDKTFAVVSIDPLEARSLALMLPRFIEPNAGRVLIDGEDIAWCTLESLRAETVLVVADDPPFDGTVFENIQGGQTELTLQQVTEAAKMTRAHNFIVKLFNGYDTFLTSHGDALDLGQRFRLNLARALVRDPALLIIEEPSAALDEDTKTLLVDAYDRICRDRTVIFLPTRMSTIRRTDQIVVLHEGKVAAIGPQAKLVTQSPVYRHWEYVNFNEFRHELQENSRLG